MDEDNKYIIIYKNKEDIDYKKIFNEYSFEILNLIDINYDKKMENDIYFDDNFEEYIFEKCLFIIYEYNYKISNNLIKLLEKYNKKILFGDISSIEEQYNEKDIKKLFNNFKEYYNNLKNYDNKLSNNNILVEIKNNNVYNNEIELILFMYYEEKNNNIINTIQKKSILENSKNKNINKIIVIGRDFDDKIESNKVFYYNYNEKLDFYNFIKIVNENYKNKLIIFCRCDIVIPTQNSFNHFYYEFLSNNNLIYAVSRIDRLINGSLMKNSNLNNILFSTEQDCWIFKSPISMNNIDCLKKKYINDLFSELYFNKILRENNKIIVNNTRNIKIIRLNNNNNIDDREMIDKDQKIEDVNDLYLIPDNQNLNNLSIDKLLENAEIDEIEYNNIKSELFNKYIKNKIFNKNNL